MVVSSRAIVTFGFGLMGLVGLASPALAQGVDPAVRKSAGPTQSPVNTGAPAATPKPKTPVAAVFGTVDLKAVFDGYDKVKAQKEELARRREGTKEAARVQLLEEEEHARQDQVAIVLQVQVRAVARQSG